MLLILNLGCDFDLGDEVSKWINEIVFPVDSNFKLN
jgi:hypothetical protein